MITPIPSPHPLWQKILPSNLLTAVLILTLLDFPEPIKESIKVLRDHIYIPLSDVQIAREEELEKQRYKKKPAETMKTLSYL